MTTELTREIIKSLLPARPEDAHKGTFGHVLVIAGSRGFTGAARLASTGAARAGAGLVTVAAPNSVINLIAQSLVECMWRGLPATPEGTLAESALQDALQDASKRDAVVLGPGISTHPETAAFVSSFVQHCTKPIVLDADALNCISAHPSIVYRALAPVVVTPHPGEMARLVGNTTNDVQRDRVNVAVGFAARTGWVVVLKGHRTVIATPDGTSFVNMTGNSGMATGGTGDILAGMIGGLLAQGLPAADAARVAVYAHGLAGDMAADEGSARGMIAGDLLCAIPRAWRTIEGNL